MLYRTEKPTVSVVLPFKDSAPFLAEAIESVRSQTFEDWELLLVNDGSTDGSTTIAERVAADLPQRVRLLSHHGQENRGVCASRNLGIEAAKGELIALLDADDVWLPSKLSRQVELLRTHPSAEMVFGAPNYWRSWSTGELALDRVLPPPGRHDVVVDPPLLFLISGPLGKGSAPCPSDLMLRKSLLDRIGAFEESFTGSNISIEDQAFLGKVFLSSRVFVSKETWIHYRIHASSISERVKREGTRRAAFRFYLNWLDEYTSTLNGVPETVLLAVNRARWAYRYPNLNRLAAMIGYRGRFPRLTHL